ncbi:uncharacterized protein PHALS_07693 [Plasmopara halstedii]|uniref:Uncharacterized protein n=1 Tax=Plasmopara halstedii TaxID=4781 RepID=A0A0P1B598_PLAHL|nr:uncharacterized protein PHALS_07693 [Plasmopara halstedii]CEG49958.1 hypothetical protein PHALS_07693 [Plasmopara halstedii]|eukprot:XP_024586327.1 hypothetical protein PHALS_07693 [Plasmopara halstedii]
MQCRGESVSRSPALVEGLSLPIQCGNITRCDLHANSLEGQRYLPTFLSVFNKIGLDEVATGQRASEMTSSDLLRGFCNCCSVSQ